jgi:hypothetical protein
VGQSSVAMDVSLRGHQPLARASEGASPAVTAFAAESHAAAAAGSDATHVTPPACARAPTRTKPTA